MRPTGGRVAVATAPAPIRPPPSEPRSYDGLSVLLQVDAGDLVVLGRSGSPMALCRSQPMTEVTMKEKTRTAKAPTAWRHSWSTPPP